MTDWKWWHRAVFYQIYPRSFADSFAGDGIGDLPGMIERLDYLKDLGIDAIWLSPHYPSPMVDCGYDIADYAGVAPEYGSLEDFKCFLESAHQRGIRLIIDLVLNHTSHMHNWFMESRSSKTSPKADWYIWKDGKNGGLPNNWLSTFGGSAWEYEPERGQYYYHYFFIEQPDLNWRNPEVKQAMFDTMRFWLDLGVDGFRMDAIGTVYEDLHLTDHKASVTQADLYYRLWMKPTKEEHKFLREQWIKMYVHQVDQPEMAGLLRELRSVVDEYDDRVLIGETDKIVYCAEDMLHMVFNFPLLETDKLTPEWVRSNQHNRLTALAQLCCTPPGAWACNTLGNHDSPRVYNRFGDGKNNDVLARLHLALLLTLRGTPFLYNSEEIGMTDLPLSDIRQFRDTLGVWMYQTMTSVLEVPPEKALSIAAQASRDKNRTPMQWNNKRNAGFTPPEIEPWLPVNPNYKDGINIAAQENDENSLLNYYRSLLNIRRRTPALIEGDYEVLHPGS
ncbi:MAG: alpha-glucosidase, partial [Chloroflexi bacterium]